MTTRKFSRHLVLSTQFLVTSRSNEKNKSFQREKVSFSLDQPKKNNWAFSTRISHFASTIRTLSQLVQTQGCRNRRDREGGEASTVFCRSVNPISTGGEQILPTTLLLASLYFRPSYGPETLLVNYRRHFLSTKIPLLG